MARQDRLMMFSQRSRKLFGHVDRAVLASRAADSNGKVTALGALVMRHPAAEKPENILEHLGERLLLVEELLHLVIETRMAAQLYGPLWVWQAAHVEHEVRVGRDAVLEAKAFDEYR